MSAHTFDYGTFTEQFPAYSTTPPESVLSVYFDLATAFINPNDNWCGGLSGARLDYALNLLVAHYAYINSLIASGTDTVIVSASTIDKVSVSLVAPPIKDSFSYWLNTSPYGKQLLALLAARAAGGWVVAPGNPERLAFRKVGGRFR